MDQRLLLFGLVNNFSKYRSFVQHAFVKISEEEAFVSLYNYCLMGHLF